MGVLDLRLARFTHREVAGHQMERDSLLAHLETLNRRQRGGRFPEGGCRRS
jgi:hypothetical protein